MATSADEVWKLLGELISAQKETEKRFEETEQILKQQAQETDRQIQQLSQEVSRVNKQISALGGKWGRFVENMVAPACETVFLSGGIPVHQVSQRVRRRLNGNTLEVDVLVENEFHVLVVEVKSSLGVEDIKEFLSDLPQFRQFFPEYAHKQLYGAVAGIEIEDSADIYAYRRGLFVLAQSGETVDITNSKDFQPRVW